MQSRISQQLDEVKSSEEAAKYSHENAKAISSLGGLVVGGVIKITAQNKQISAFADKLLKNQAGEQSPFGTVLVGIGPKGLPDDVGVVSVSRLAREWNRKESEIIHELKEHGYLLFYEKSFSALIDKLIEGVQEGRLVLPIATEKLSEIATSSCLTVKAGNSEWVRILRPSIIRWVFFMALSNASVGIAG